LLGGEKKPGQEVVVSGLGETEQVMKVTKAGKPKVVAQIGRVQLTETSFTLKPKDTKKATD